MSRDSTDRATRGGEAARRHGRIDFPQCEPKRDLTPPPLRPAVIVKRPQDLRVTPNLVDDAATRKRFSWGDAAAELGIEPGGAVNIAACAIDRHLANRARALRRAPRRVRERERREPLFSAFGPEPIKTRLALGEGKVVVTTEALYPRKIAPIAGELPLLAHVIVAGEAGRTTHIPGTHDFAKLLADERVGVWYTAPTAIRILMKAGSTLARSHRFPALRVVASVGEAARPEAVRWGVDALGMPIHDNWWQTETGGIMIANTAALDVKPGSMGRPLPGIDACIVNRADGDALALDELMRRLSDLVALHERVHVDVPEADYSRLRTLDDIVDDLVEKARLRSESPIRLRD